MRKSLAFLLLAAAAFSAHAGDFKLTTDAANAQGVIAQPFAYAGFGCTGKNLAPSVHWEGVPADARSLALTVYDPDAPTGSGWWHWFVVDLPADTRALPAGKPLPAGAHALRNDYGDAGWGGPCPPAGDTPHHYIFTVYALDVPKLDIPAGASPALAGFMIHAHTLGKTQLTLTYGR